MKLTVIAVGVRMPAWVTEGWKDYAKRFPADCALELREVKPEPRNSGKTSAQIMQAEARRIEALLPARTRTIALDERGRDLSTMKLATELEHWRTQGHDTTFVIGGPDGLHPDFKQRCNDRLRLSSLTLPHPLVRIFLAEQLYRAWSIMVNHPYHRA